MEVRQQLIPAGHPNRPGTKLETLKAIVFHYTANAHPDADAIMNAKYFARSYVKKDDGKFYEKDQTTKFGYGSAQIIADKEKVIIALPLDEVAYACGDKHNPGHPEWNEQQALAKLAFNYRQNHQTISVEICNNSDWNSASKNAVQWAADFLRERNLSVDLEQSLNPQQFHSLTPGKVLLVRHFDITAKICPKPFIDDQQAWISFVQKIAGM